MATNTKEDIIILSIEETITIERIEEAGIQILTLAGGTEIIRIRDKIIIMQARTM